ncbi:MAG TPA: hypothetical protein VK722_01700 [Candidatus Aquilonibacter sp.]|jgi:hypothetical protein|nr:hypothetical protein [Candidatus Aquilonibacter sp.]
MSHAVNVTANSNSSRPRQIAQVNIRLDKRLAAYMSAAGAAGVGMLALATPAHAKIVYTPDNRQLPANGDLSVDLNHDGISDFILSNFYSSTSSVLGLSISPVDASNEIFSAGSVDHSVFAAALPAGIKVGPNGKFQKRLGEGIAVGNNLNDSCRGPWVHARQQYLGLKFIINGETHFGWARLNVNCVFPQPVHAVLTGYAYETVANKPIVSGDTKGADVSDNPGTLGNLARGAAAIPDLRDEPNRR